MEKRMSTNREYFSWKSLSWYVDEQKDEGSYPSVSDMKYNLSRLAEDIRCKMHYSYQYWLWWLTMLPLLIAVWCRLKITGHCRLPNSVIRLMHGDTNTTFSAMKLAYFYIGLVMLHQKVRPTDLCLPYLWGRWRLLVKIIVRHIRNA
jgi:hypothetical protein